MAKQELSGERNWYAIHTYAGYENAVMRNLKQRIDSLGMHDKIFNVIVPVEGSKVAVPVAAGVPVPFPAAVANVILPVSLSKDVLTSLHSRGFVFASELCTGAAANSVFGVFCVFSLRVFILANQIWVFGYLVIRMCVNNNCIYLIINQFCVIF